MPAAKKKPRITDLVPSDPDLPPAATVRRFVTFYMNHFDLKLAACQARLMPEMGERLYKQPKVREMIDHATMLVEAETAKMQAKARMLTVEKLDCALVEEVNSKKNGHVRVRAIELGYRRTGMIREGEFYIAPDPNAANKGAPSIYRAQQTSMKRTVTEEVTQTTTVIAPAQDPIFAVQEY